MQKSIPKQATCVRNLSSWADLKPEYKFDSPKFSPNELLSNLSLLSPKMNALIKKIEELDANDIKNENKLYKHIIYSDVAGVYGAKMVASVLIANGYKMVYDNKNKINDSELSNKTFALLTMSTVYQKPLPVGLKKKVLHTLNQRPNNINGDDIRFLIIDSGFKEGIDVFDVKYIHLLEPLVTKAEQTQVIGRGTRYCGQKGLEFKPDIGWPLNVYRYNIKYDDNTDLHELYLQKCNNNISSLNFMADIEDLLITSACDLRLTANIHNYEARNNRFFNLIKPIFKKTYNINKDKIVGNVKGKIFTNVDKIKCEMRCKGKLETAHTGMLLVGAIYTNKKELINILYDKFPKPKLCQFIDKLPSYCNILNLLWSNPEGFFKIYGKDFNKTYDELKKSYSIHEKNISIIDDYIKNHKTLKNNALIENLYKAVPPKIKLPYVELQEYIDNHFSSYKWPEMEKKNMCIEVKKEDDNVQQNNIISFTNTQKFVKDFMTPQSPYNGMFLYHSVGSGKTCTAIATATSTFDKQGYTILWVTRHTLKQDIWKNMFDSVCNIIIQEKISNGEHIPSSMADKMKMLGNNWMQPISYKQFTNMIAGKNKLYDEMVKRNGKEDPFQKTFIIIDEIHKIYSNTLNHLEKPNPILLKNMVHHSYDMKKINKDHIPLKLLLMSATPITEDNMSVIKILNLLLDKTDNFPEIFEDFRLQYCNDNGLFTDNGAINFMNKVSGLVSYIDRTNDISHFAYPIITDITLKPLSFDNNKDIEIIQKQIIDKQDELNKLVNNKIKMSKNEKQLYTNKVKELKQQIKQNMKDIKNLTLVEQKNNYKEYINSCFVKYKNSVQKTKSNTPKKSYISA